MKIEIVQMHDEQLDKTVNALSVDGNIFDWGMEKKEFEEAKKIILHDPKLRESIMLSIINHIVENFSDFIGRKITLNELNKAIKAGEIK